MRNNELNDKFKDEFVEFLNAFQESNNCRLTMLEIETNDEGMALTVETAVAKPVLMN